MSNLSYAYGSQHLDNSDLNKTAVSTTGETIPSELSINTFDGETAGSGYGWISSIDAEPHCDLACVEESQRVELRMLNQQIESMKEQIGLCLNDERLITEFIAVNFMKEKESIKEGMEYSMLHEIVKKLENEVDELRKISPGTVSLPSPGTPQRHSTWSCTRCLEENPIVAYRCRCLFPRAAIDPCEAIKCNCIHCSQIKAYEIF